MGSMPLIYFAAEDISVDSLRVEAGAGEHQEKQLMTLMFRGEGKLREERDLYSS
jgi:hypothetical protein